jgi:aldose 1-epimerase
MYHPKTGIHLDVETTEPAFQVYTGEGIKVPEINEDGHKVPARGARSGIAIEPSRYVNAVNVEEWKHMVALKKGEVWGSKSRFTAYKQ